MIITAAAFARLAGVSKVAVSKAPDGKVHKEPDGKVDTLHPTNAKYLAEHTGTVHAPKPSPPAKKTKAVDPAEAAEQAQFQKAVAKRQAKKLARAEGHGDDDLSPEDKAAQDALRQTIADLMGETADLDIKKKRADIALKVAMEKRHSFKLAQDKGLVISREEFRRIAEGWNAQLAQSVMRVPRRVVSRMVSMVKAGDDARTIEAYLEKELGKAVTRALEGVHGAK